MNRPHRVEATPPECALAAEMFDHFCSASTMKQILALHREICNTLNLKPNRLLDFYPKLKKKLESSWKAQALFKKFDARSNHKVYMKGQACPQTRVLIIGAGPCGLRAAIECQLLGAKVVVIEKRDRISRNNVLHLWPFVIQDLRALGAKKFFGKFCAGSIDHISIRQLQCILLKVALLLGVEFHEGVSFEELLEPTVTDSNETLGWRARVLPADHVVSQYEFDTLIGADGRRNTLEGFKRKEFRGKLAMAITANFINRHSEQEASVPEISGVAFIFNQKFFKDLYKETDIDLENIVYYKDETHYFVMTAKKHSLLKKGVLKQDFSEVNRLLNVENVDREALMRYAQEAARFSTDNRLPLTDFALNHYGGPDVALFDFTSMYAAENASLVCERVNRRLLCLLVGDSLLEPFWPTGSGCARGFLSALDAAWAVRAWGQTPTPHPLCVIAERESIYRLLAQTTPENLHRDFGAYTLDPGTRYPNLNRGAVTPHRVTAFYDSDEPMRLDAINTSRKRLRDTEIPDQVLMSWLGIEPGLGVYEAASPQCLTAVVRRYRPDLLSIDAPERSVYHVLQEELDIAPFVGAPREVPEAKLRSYLVRVYYAFKGEVPHVHHDSDVFGQIKRSQQTEKYGRNTADHSISMYSNAADTEKSHSTKRKRRTPRPPLVSNDPTDFIRTKIGKLDLDDITHLARLIEGHESLTDDGQSLDKQKYIQDEILALLDPDESPDPQLVRESIAQLLQGPTRVTVNKPGHSKVATMFANNDVKPVRPPRRLKGLDVSSMNYPDLSEEALDTDVTVTPEVTKPQRRLKGLDVASMRYLAEEAKKDNKVEAKKKFFVKSKSIDVPLAGSNENLQNDVTVKQRYSQSPELKPKTRSNSVGGSKKTRRIAELFENKRVIPEPRLTRSATVTAPLAMKMQRMTDMIEGKQKHPQLERTKRTESIGNPELVMRRQKVAELIQGIKPNSSQDRTRNTSELASRMQRVSDIVQKKSTEKKHRKEGRRKAAREITKQRFEKSLRLLAAEPPTSSTSADLEHDYGLQQYRASAPQFDERVKKLERKLQHYEEGRIVSGGGRNLAGGARVARLAAELASGNASTSTPKSSKPKDLMRSVGKIERNDWNVQFIEKKIMENQLGRPEPKTAERVPKWDREQFLGRQRRLQQEGEPEEKWGELDETIHKIDQKLKDSGRPDHGTKKVANLATKFVKKEDEKIDDKVLEDAKDLKKTWRGPSTTGIQCAACSKRVFAAESVIADGLHLHRACFKCAVCKTILRPGNYTMERYGSRLVCLRHSGTSVPDAVEAVKAAAAEALKRSRTVQATPERIILEASDTGAREIDEDEWTDRNFLASETSGAGGLSDEDDSSTEDYTSIEDSEAEEDDVGEGIDHPQLNQRHPNLYFSTDSFGYDDSDDGVESSGNESCSRMREAREARRREVPADARPPTDSSEVASDDESSSSSDSDVSSATQVSTDSEFAREENLPPPSPPAILVTAPPPAPPPALEYPLSRTKSAGGLATKRALELKRKYLLGEPSPPTVRKSDSTSQLDTKFEAFRSNITGFQKLLQMSPQPPSRQIITLQMTTEKSPIPDIIKNIYDDAPVDLLPKDKEINGTDWKEDDKNVSPIDTDSLSDDVTNTESMVNQSVPRVEVHDEGGELIQLDSLTIVSDLEEDELNKPIYISGVPIVVSVDSDSSESCKGVTTLALTETELSDWATESVLLDDCHLDENEDKHRNKNPRTLSGPKTIHDEKNVSTLAAHVCGKSNPPETIVYSNALDYFEFVDEGEQDPTIETPVTPKNEGYMEFVDDEYDPYSIANDRSMNFIERSFSEIAVKPDNDEAVTPVYSVERSFSEIAVKRDSDDQVSTPTYSVHEQPIYETINTVIESNMNECKETEIVCIDKTPNSSESSSVSKGNLDSELKTPKMLSMMESNGNKSQNNSHIEHSDIKENTDIISYEILSPVNGNDSDPKPSSDNSFLLETPSSTNSSKCDRFDDDTNKVSKNISLSEISPPLYNTPITKSASNYFSLLPQKPLFSPSICRSASENFSRNSSSSLSKPTDLSLELSSSSVTTQDSKTPVGDLLDKLQEITREIEEQKEVVRRLVLQRLGTGGLTRKSTRRARVSPMSNIPPPIPPPILKLPTPPVTPTEERRVESPPPRPFPPSPAAMKDPKQEDSPPPRPVPPTNLQPNLVKTPPSLSDTELAKERRHNSFIKSLSNYLTRRRGPRNKWVSEPDLRQNESPPQPPSSLRQRSSHKSTGALETPPPVPPPPARYCPPPASTPRRNMPSSSRSEAENGNISPHPWYEARWTRLLAQRRRDDNVTNKNCAPDAKSHEKSRQDEPTSRRIAQLEKALSRPLSAEQQAATVAELVQVSAQRVAHEALLAADRNRNLSATEKKYAA